MTTFIKIHNKVVSVEAISYVEFLESGRAMVFMRGLSHEKQNISVDPEEAKRLKAVFDAFVAASS